MAVMKKIYDIAVTNRQYSELKRLLELKKKKAFWERLADITEIDPEWLRTRMEFCAIKATPAPMGMGQFSPAVFGIQGIVLFHGPVPQHDSGVLRERDVDVG